jgi:hypothetical protein
VPPSSRRRALGALACLPGIAAGLRAPAAVRAPADEHTSSWSVRADLDTVVHRDRSIWQLRQVEVI